MSDNKTQRLTIRFTDEDLHWLDQQAMDEGVEPATLVRMIVHRLRNGRPPLVGQMLERPVLMPAGFDDRPGAINRIDVHRPVASHLPPLPMGGADEGYDPGEPVASGVAAEILESRLAEADLADPAAPPAPPNGHGAAVSLRHVPREKYNPGRQ